MTGTWDDRVGVARLSDDDLADALLAGAGEADWSEQAAVELIVEQRSWLRRSEFRHAVEAEVGDDGQLCAWVDWTALAVDTPASGGELRILALARSLGGVATQRSLADLLISLDDNNIARVLRAVSTACRGRSLLRSDPDECGEGVVW
jgi:hypothetical protein